MDNKKFATVEHTTGIYYGVRWFFLGKNLYQMHAEKNVVINFTLKTRSSGIH